MWQDARTVADGLRVPKAVGDFLVLRAVRESGGTALAVTDAEMVAGMRELGPPRRHQRRARRRRRAARRSSSCSRDGHDQTPTRPSSLFNTGGALKYLDVLAH